MILEAAFIEVIKNGFQAASVDKIIRNTSLTKGAFYHHFPTKLELGYALVDEIICHLILTRWIQPLENFENPLKGILFLLKKLIGDASSEELRLGCPLNNLVQEMAPIDYGFRQRLKKALAFWIDGIKVQLDKGKFLGFVNKDVNSHQAALFIVMAHEGFYSTIKGVGYENGDTFKALYKSLHKYLNQLAA